MWFYFRRDIYTPLTRRLRNSERSLAAIGSIGYRFDHRHPLMSLGRSMDEIRRRTEAAEAEPSAPQARPSVAEAGPDAP